MSKMRLTEICRTCDARECKSLHHLNERIEDYPEVLADMLQEFIQIDLPDGFAEQLPQYICDGCLDRLLDAHNFVAQARDATELLIKQLSKEKPVEKPKRVTVVQNPHTTLEADLHNVEVKLESDITIFNETLESSDAESQSKQHMEEINPKATALDDQSEVNKEEPLRNASLELLKCDLCEKTFNRRSKLEGHKRTHAGENLGKPFKCDICEKAFNRRDTLEYHQRTHTGKKPFKCDMCEKTFNNLTNMRIHRRTHSGGNPFKCDFCARTFNNRCHMQEHRRTHTGEKPFKCDFCEKVFTQRGTMQIHRRTHTGDRPFKCEICDKAFRNRSNMIDHRRTHAVERTIKCDLCDKTYTNRANMKSHRQTHNKKEAFKCELCKKTFKYKRSLQIHRCKLSGEKSKKKKNVVYSSSDSN